ncbi:putative bifunctional diguanylate cyclase/phosphodiesterase [Methylocystis parvus]|uniref:EAL domain-containing protein n=1 Tax=Methylocystis parvus TaxID=134 RepID=A0A6B8M740_9HYPH|nr:GGDEF domain-containing phosphodiesterase [Methylocystis parvus]QGM96630.1 EAL domain-containing protein [Methylocystis parvus]WBJ99513.1 EAL domain-containing protein [Methylocystis parvus OBBP]
MQLRHIANRGSEAPVATTIRSSILKAPLQAQPAAPPAAAPPPAALEMSSGPDPRQILSSIGEVVYTWDIVTDRLTWGPNLAEILGAIAQDDLGTGLAYGERVAGEGGGSRYDAIMRSDQTDNGEGASFQVVYALRQPRELGPAPAIWIEDTGRWFKGEDGKPVRAHGVVRVVTERHEMERKLALGSQIDPLTGVLNRAQLAEHVNRFLQQAERTRKPFAVLLVALENLFALNRTYGYDAGDEVIAGLARRLRENVRTCDVVARHAGNKFALVLDNCDAEQTLAVANRLLELVKGAPFETSAGAIPATIRIGGVIGPREGRAPRVLFQHAEEALDVARQAAGKRFVPYTSSLAREDARLRALHVADSIVSALNERRVELAFQPIVYAATGEVAFHEALLRVRLPDGSSLSPAALLPIAEKAGLVRLLDQRVMELTLERLTAEPDFRASVNCSMNTVLDPEWPDRLAAAIALNPSIPDRLIVEITETCMIEDFETTKNLIAACKQLGVKVAMDDFGAGHTSFRNLRDLAFDIVKIDGAFIQNIATSADDRFFVRTLIDLARHLSLKVVAEWVEDEATARILRDWGVEFFQGALYGRAESHPRPQIEDKRQLAGAFI